jgi:phenylacetate-CoA ligase
MHPWIVRHITFPLYRRIIGERVLDCLQDLERTQWYSPFQLRDLQWAKLKRLLIYCYDNVPYYRAVFDKLDIKPEDVKDMDDFRRLPLLSKGKLRRNRTQMLAKGGTHRYVTDRTSGSSGIPTEVQISRLASAYHFAAQVRGRGWWGWNIGAAHAWLWGSLGTMQSLRKLKRHFADNTTLFLSVYDLGPESVTRYFRQMRRHRVQFVYGFSSALYALARGIKECNLDGQALGLKGVCSTSEVLYPYQRQMMEKLFGCPVMNEYGCVEVGIIAFECPEGGMHLCSENVLVEFVKDGEPANPGQTASIIVTDLMNYRMPLIRYRVGDVGRHSADVCFCGRGLPLMEVSIGREWDLIRLEDGRILHPDILHLPHDNSVLFEKVRQYKVHQRSLSHFSIQIEAEPDSESLLRDAFSEFVRDKLGESISIEIEYVERIPREKSGKLRYFVSDINAARKLPIESLASDIVLE